MKKIFDKFISPINYAASDAKWIKDHEVWSYNIECKKMEDNKRYRVVIYEIEKDINEN